MNTSELIKIVRAAWSTVPAPPKDDMNSMGSGWGEDAALAFTGVAPMDVDVESCGFAAATPLLDLPPRAAAAYLGAYLLSLLKGQEFQRVVGFPDDVVTRAHTLNCLSDQDFWNEVIRKHLPPECQRAVEVVALHLAANPEAVYLDQKQGDRLRELATQPYR